jgi:hypothetical protein
LTDVLELAGGFIAVCWVVFIVVWFIAAWFAKRTVERADTWLGWIVWIVAILLVATRSGWMGLANGRRGARRPGICTPETWNRSYATSAQPKDSYSFPVLASQVGPL